VDAVNIAKRPVALFGSFGWSGEAFTFAEQRLRLLKCNVYDEQLKINFVPAADDLARAEAFGATFATPLQAGS
jgi:flavorubredoxin